MSVYTVSTDIIFFFFFFACIFIPYSEKTLEQKSVSLEAQFNTTTRCERVKVEDLLESRHKVRWRGQPAPE